MTNVILVSHSEMLAKATAEFILKMAPRNEYVRLSYVGGDNNGGFGNSYSKILNILKKHHNKHTKTLLFCDLGSAIMITKTVITQENFSNQNCKIVNAPFVEGAFMAYSSLTKININEVIMMCEQKLEKSI